MSTTMPGAVDSNASEYWMLEIGERPAWHFAAVSGGRASIKASVSHFLCRVSPGLPSWVRACQEVYTAESSAKMHHSLLTIVGALALVQAQKIELDKVAAAPGPSLVSAPLVIASDDPPDVEAPPVKPITKAAAVAAAPTKLRRARRSAKLLKRDGDCSLEPAGAGPVPSPDTPEAFLSSPDISVR